MRWAGCCVLLLLSGVVQAQQRRIDVPIVLGGNADYPACPGSGQIVGLDPNGDGFLSVMSGPGGRPFREIDRLYNGNLVILCERRDRWLAVVYAGSEQDCGLADPWPVRQPYTGPCRFGWIHSSYVQGVAGGI